jgi:hypothetical protein
VVRYGDQEESAPSQELLPKVGDGTKLAPHAGMVAGFCNKAKSRKLSRIDRVKKIIESIEHDGFPLDPRYPIYQVNRKVHASS